MADCYRGVRWWDGKRQVFRPDMSPLPGAPVDGFDWAIPTVNPDPRRKLRAFALGRAILLDRLHDLERVNRLALPFWEKFTSKIGKFGDSSWGYRGCYIDATIAEIEAATKQEV